MASLALPAPLRSRGDARCSARSAVVNLLAGNENSRSKRLRSARGTAGEKKASAVTKRSLFKDSVGALAGKSGLSAP